MGKKTIAAGLALLIALAFAGCMRQSAYYYIQSDNTVDGVIYTALHEDYVDESDPYRGTGAGDIAAAFEHSTIEEFDNGPWKGYHITFEDEPLSTFAGAPTESWDIQITKAGSQFVAYGYQPTEDDESVRQAIQDNDGFLQLTVSFPGKLVEEMGAKETSDADEAPGWASFDQLASTNQPYAKGNGGLYVFLIPGLADLFLPSGDPDPDPIPDPPADEPEPVVTVVVTPSPQPSATASPSPSATAVAHAADDSDSSIPIWVWIVGALLLAGVAGLGGVLLASRGRAEAAQAAEPAEAPAKPKATPKEKAAE